jgi:hypothetical protein
MVGYIQTVKLTGPTSYTTGGIAISASQFNFFILDHLIIKSVSGGLIAQWDETNSKIILLYPTGGATAPASLGAPTSTATPASGATAVTSTAAQPAIPVTKVAGVAKEVAASTDVSSIVIEVMAFGR